MVFAEGVVVFVIISPMRLGGHRIRARLALYNKRYRKLKSLLKNMKRQYPIPSDEVKIINNIGGNDDRNAPPN